MSFHTTIARLREASFAAPVAGENPNTCRVGRQDLRTALHVIDRLDADLRQAGTLAHGALDPAPRAVNGPVANSIQWPTMPACKGQSPVLFEDGYAEGWAKCMDECRRAVSQASAPVAGEAVDLQDAREYLGQWGCLANPNVRALLENAERASLASAPVADERAVANAQAAFEAWSEGTNQGYDLTRMNSGKLATYESDLTEHAWRGYCHAALASAPVAEQAALSVRSATKDDKAALGMPECGKPLCAPGEHHPLCRHGWAEKKAASAPVAGDTLSEQDRKQVEAFIDCDGLGAMIVEADRYSAVVRALQSGYAAPQASEAVGDASDMDDLRSRVLAAIHDCAALTPEDDESWDEWYCAAFDLLGSRVGEIFRVALSAQPADKPATPRAAPALKPRQQCVCRQPETGNAHTDGGAVYE